MENILLNKASVWLKTNEIKIELKHLGKLTSAEDVIAAVTSQFNGLTKLLNRSGKSN